MTFYFSTFKFEPYKRYCNTPEHKKFILSKDDLQHSWTRKAAIPGVFRRATIILPLSLFYPAPWMTERRVQDRLRFAVKNSDYDKTVALINAGVNVSLCL